MYKASEYKVAGDFVSSDVLVERIPVRPPSGELMSVLVEISAGTKTDIALFESVDGSDWTAVGTSATYGSNYGVVSFKGIANFPIGTLLQLRAAGNITVDRVLVVQNW